MKPKEYLIMILLSALWGSSFIFMKISSPELGPILTAALRVSIATVTLSMVLYFNKTKMDFFKNWRKYLIIGTLNAALPFALICTAELHIDASLAAILNATTPAFTALIVSFLGDDKINFEKFIGLAFGFIGVIVLVGWNGINDITVLIYASFSIIAAISYSFAGVFSSKAFKNINPLNIAFGQQLSGSLILLPFGILNFPSKMPSYNAIISVIILAVFCTAIAYLFFFYLINQVGAVKTLTVTFLVPIFGVIWGTIFLKEVLTMHNIIGLLVIAVSIPLINNQVGNFFVSRNTTKSIN